MNIAFFITPHGFGHAARACAVMGAIHRRAADSFFHVFTRVPRWFFEDSLPTCYRYHDLLTDVGLVQTSPLAADLGATLDVLSGFLPFPADTVAFQAEKLGRLDCRAVVCDISPLGIAVARTAGLPAILVENFTWDWIYEPYVAAHPGFGPVVDYLDRVFQSATVHIQTDPVCRPRPGVTRLGSMSRAPRTPVGRLRSRLGIPEGSPVVLITMGGVGTRHRFAARLKERPDIRFILPQDISETIHDGNLIHLPQRSGYYHPDLIQAADVVVGKVGYSTLAETCHAGKPFAYISRDGFRESPPLSAYADRHAAGMEIPRSEFESGDWLARVDGLLERGGRLNPVENAVDRAAGIILDTAGVVGSQLVRENPGGGAGRFDPFADRKARDIRNQLSETFIVSLAENDPAMIEKLVDGFPDHAGVPPYRDYIADRCRRYRAVSEKIRSRGMTDPLERACVIWNAGLFFECHEQLEPVWLRTTGDRREALKGLIQAAGVYVHLDRGNRTAARRMATKAARLVAGFRHELSFIQNMNDLLVALDRVEAPAPRLECPGGR